MAAGNLHIPVKLMKRYSQNKSDWDLFVLAICIKLVEGSSAIHPTVPLLRKITGCNLRKAKRLLEAVKNNTELFVYYPEANYLIARSFTRGKLEKSTYYTKGRKPRSFTAYHTQCYKLKHSGGKTASHYNVSRELKDALIVHAIKASELKNSYTISKGENNLFSSSTCSNRSRALSQVKLGKICNYCRNTVSRHIRILESQGKLTVNRQPFVPVVDLRQGEVLSDDPDLPHRNLFVCRGGYYLCYRNTNEYGITDKCEFVFTNIIFNHVQRHSRNCCVKKRGNVLVGSAGYVEHLNRTSLAHLWL